MVVEKPTSVLTQILTRVITHLIRSKPRISKFYSYAPLNDSIDSLYLDAHDSEKH